MHLNEDLQNIIKQEYIIKWWNSVGINPKTQETEAGASPKFKVNMVYI